MQLNNIEEIIEDIKQGKMVVIMDDEDRENEGDLLMAASAVTPEDINFMARYGRGLICLTLSEARCRQLRLPQMVDSTDDMHGTNFTVSIEAAEGVTTGISAADRAITVQAAVAADATPQDIVQPGHVFPLKAQRGGVLNRAGHTEAGCDLARLAGFEPAAVIVEILNDDGSMARRPDLEKFAIEHNLKIGTIEDLIRYRIQNEKTVERVAESDFPNEFGHFRLYAYQDEIGNDLHLALVHGKIDPKKPVRVRVHMENTLCDVLASSRKCGWPLRDAMEEIAKAEEPGVIVILREPESARQIVQTMLDHSEEHKSESDSPEELRTHGIGAQILMDLSVHKMRLMSAPKRIHGLAGFGLEVVDYVSGED
ncbi:3,4-dihydroxy-2-butanone 4-phosphate synthase / GTP cyclohydrolase II [hydrothermal vent metagenome]|uniref:3,4-dihydroxy-2-butanone 4-phosphate synthase / GTP cyclohydrolase II n=1 Tax=hydrothermal vent metagenome TaxID=652676 RepID=A0A3B0XKD9_9ZZZZ